MTGVTFDPPRYDIALEVIGLVVTISVIPMLIWHLYRIVVAYQSKGTWFLAVFLVQAVCSLSYEFLALYTTFIDTNVYLTIMRTDLASSTILLMPFVLREIMTTFAVADPSIPAWAPNVVCGLLLVIFFATMTPRYFLYILYVSVREDSFIAKVRRA
ncbi:hypothetical protein BC831DRAFT_250673 [Entophlyctis helioformis]|nr:hypothetical protein BC831DRAFT_250673 [Entophlyctis helioformis]